MPVGTLGRIDDDQFALLTEGLFFSVFRSYENCVEQIFINYMMGERSSSGRRPYSYVSPRDYSHARALVKGGSNYIDWNSPSNLIQRSELFLREGFIIKSTIVANKSLIEEMVKIRNHVAHKSNESMNKYQAVLRNRLRTVPVDPPIAGQFLNMSMKDDRENYHLKFYFAQLLIIIYALTH